MSAAPQFFAAKAKPEHSDLPTYSPQVDRWKLADILSYPRTARTNSPTTELAEGLQVARITFLQCNCKKLAQRAKSQMDREVEKTLDYLQARSVFMDHCSFINKEAFSAQNIDYPEITETDLCLMIQKAQAAFIDWINRTIPASTSCIETLDLCLLILQQFHDLADAPRDSTTYSIPPQSANHLADHGHFDTFAMTVDHLMASWKVLCTVFSDHSENPQLIADTFGELEIWNEDPFSFNTQLQARYKRLQANPAQAKTRIHQLAQHFQKVIDEHSAPKTTQSSAASAQTLSLAKEIQHKLAILASFL